MDCIAFKVQMLSDKDAQEGDGCVKARNVRAEQELTKILRLGKRSSGWGWTTADKVRKEWTRMQRLSKQDKVWKLATTDTRGAHRGMPDQPRRVRVRL